jgi:hypothetical protein
MLPGLFFSCSKYEDGPAISFLSKKKRLTGHWEIVEISNPNKLAKPINPVSTMEFKKDNTGILTKINSSGENEIAYYNWEFFNTGEKLKLDYESHTREHYIIDDSIALTIDSLTFQNFEITRLKKNELWLKGYYDIVLKFEKK